MSAAGPHGKSFFEECSIGSFETRIIDLGNAQAEKFEKARGRLRALLLHLWEKPKKSPSGGRASAAKPAARAKKKK
jgi:hypothetical protein